MERLKDEADSVVANISQPTAGIGRCLGIHLPDGSDQIEGLDRDTFVAGADANGGETMDVTPITELETGGNSYVTVTVEVDRWEPGPDNGPAEIGTVSDATGTIDIIDFFGTGHIGPEIEEGVTLRFEKARVSSYNGTLQLEIVKNTTTVTEIQSGVGTLPAGSPDDDEQETVEMTSTDGDAGAGGSGGGETAAADGGTELPLTRTREFFDELDATDAATVEDVMDEVGVDRETTEEVLTYLAHQGKIYEPKDGGYRGV